MNTSNTVFGVFIEKIIENYSELHSTNIFNNLFPDDDLLFAGTGKSVVSIQIILSDICFSLKDKKKQLSIYTKDMNIHEKNKFIGSITSIINLFKESFSESRLENRSHQYNKLLLIDIVLETSEFLMNSRDVLEMDKSLTSFSEFAYDIWRHEHKYFPSKDYHSMDNPIRKGDNGYLSVNRILPNYMITDQDVDLCVHLTNKDANFIKNIKNKTLIKKIKNHPNYKKVS